MLYIIRGVPGSGKTTLAENLLTSGVVDIIFAADDWCYDEMGNYNWDPSKLRENHEACQKATEDALARGMSVAVHNTFTTERELEPYISMAKRHNVKFFSIIVENRHGNESVHGVPSKSVERMKSRFSVRL